jgi:NADPH2:quinone reductase
VALDNVGAETLQRTFRAMAPYGRIITLMGTPGDDSEGNAYNKNLTLHNLMMLTPMWRCLKDRLRRQAEIVEEAMALLATRKHHQPCRLYPAGHRYPPWPSCG